MFSLKDFGLQPDLILVVSVVVIFILFILVLVLFSKLSGLRRKYDSFMAGQDGKSLQTTFEKKFENMDYINQRLSEIDEHLDVVDANLLISYQKLGVVRYDALGEVGGSLSFVVTLLTKQNDGIILNTMHSNNDGCYTYIKEVKGGRVSVEMSEEEQRSLAMAMGGMDAHDPTQ